MGLHKKGCVNVINWQLATLSQKLSEYVIFLELNHLSKMNHQKKFDYKLAQIVPDYKIKEKQLHEYNISNLVKNQFLII